MSTDATPSELDLAPIKALYRQSTVAVDWRGELAYSEARGWVPALVDEVERLHQETRDMADWAGVNVNAVRAVRELHVRKVYELSGGKDWLSNQCVACQYEYPCPTILAIDEVVKP